MSRMYGHLVTLIGCIVSCLAFCFLPYLVVSGTSFQFTGLQLVNSGSQIPLPHYYTIQSASTGNIQGVLQNDQSVDLLLVMIIVMGLLAIGGLWWSGMRRSPAKGLALGIIATIILAFLFALCSFTRYVAAGFDFMDAHANTLSGIVRGSFGVGVLGVWLGMLVVLIGSVITLRSEDNSGD